MSDLPPEVIIDIFSRLPVKSLLRFRWVSKSYCALIDSPEFVKSHLDQTLKSNSHRSIINRHRYLYSIDFDSLDRAILLDHPLKSPSIGTNVLGSCNGLLCLSNSQEDNVLWNPSTRRHHRLPVTEIEFPDNDDMFTGCDKIVYGFGYDNVNDDYKVVRIIQFFGVALHTVKVYSLKANLWRRIEDFPYCLCSKSCHGILVSNRLHWVVTEVELVYDEYDSEDESVEFENSKLIASLDLATEKYCLIPQPEYLDKQLHMNVGELGGKLCVLCSYYLKYMDIWVMNDYGVKESWTKLFSVAQPIDIRAFEYVRPIAYSKDGEQVLVDQDSMKLLWYDLKAKTIKFISISDLTSEVEAYMCIGSLVKLPDHARTEVTQEKKKKKTSQKRDTFLSEGFNLAL